MGLRKISCILALCVMALSAYAVPARRGGQLRKAADGREIMVYMHGNEDFHYLTDASGVWLDEETLEPLSEAVKSEKLKVKSERQARRAVQATGVDRLLAPKGPVILVNFTDTAFSNSLEAVTEWVKGENYSVGGTQGSIRQYFYDNSFGQYDIDFDVYGPVTLSHECSYYGANWGNVDGRDMHPGEMVKEACQLVNQQFDVDFSQYDYNEDEEVDWVVIVYAGHGEADSYYTNTVWPHQSTVSGLTLDGKRIGRYCCTNEIAWNGGLAGIGVFVHEFSHIMGLPDLYTTDYSTHKTLAEWDIMDYGCYNGDLKCPPMYSSYERWWMGWLNPKQLHTDSANITLEDLNHSQEAYFVTANGDSIENILSPYPTTFYMIENRQQSSWDTYLPGHGMLVTKVNYKYTWWSGNSVNNSANNMGVDILEADGLAPSRNDSDPYNGYYGKPGDAYPNGATSFTQLNDYQITDIAETNGVITFKVNGGRETPSAIEHTNHSVQNTKKILRNGQLFIIRNGKEYDILGHENNQL